jgi:hypothetical protein
MTMSESSVAVDTERIGGAANEALMKLIKDEDVPDEILS